MAMIENIYETMNLRITETAFELHLRKIYPTRNILSMRETETVSGQECLDVQKKTDGSVNIYAFVYDEEIAGLFFYFIHNLLHANIVHLQCYFRGLGIRSPCGERGANYE